MVECEKIIKRDAFLKAIEVEDAPSVAEGLDIDNMILESGYDGAELGDKMTLEFVEDMIERFKNGKKIAKKYAYKIILAVMDISRKEPTMIEHDVEDGHEVTVCGDTHGRQTRYRISLHMLTVIRSILRSHEHLQACRQAFREALVPVQR